MPSNLLIVLLCSLIKATSSMCKEVVKTWDSSLHKLFCLVESRVGVVTVPEIQQNSWGNKLCHYLTNIFESGVYFVIQTNKNKN